MGGVVTTLRAPPIDEHTPVVGIDDWPAEWIAARRAEGYRGPIAIEALTPDGRTYLVGILRGLDE